MTISSTLNKAQFTGDGVTLSFNFPYIFFADADLVVTTTVISTGVETVQTLNGSGSHDYSISGVFDSAQQAYLSGANVVMNVAPASTLRVTVKRVVAITQSANYIDGDAVPAETLERNLDRLTVIAQQIQESLDRAIKVAETSTLAATALIFPEPGDGKFIQWSAGKLVASTPASTNVSLPLTIANGGHGSTTAKGGLDALGGCQVFRGKTVAPTVNDDSNPATGDLLTHDEGDVWVDETANIAYVCLDATAGAAIWKEILQNTGSYDWTDVQRQTAATVTSSATPTFDLTTANFHRLAMAHTITGITLSNTAAAAHAVYILIFEQGPGAYTITGWPVSVKWRDGSQPVMPSTAGEKLIVMLFWDTTDDEYVGVYADTQA